MIFIFKFIFFSITISLALYSAILGVDPYDKYGFDLLDLKVKAVNSYRDNKFQQIDKGLVNYDLFIIGSSRSQGFDPKYIENMFKYKAFNYGVNNSKPEDLLAITKHIIAKQNPKVLLLHLDFYMLNKNIPVDGRLKASPLRHYLDKNIKKDLNNRNLYFYEPSYATLEALKDAFRIIMKNKLGTIKVTHNKNGMKLGYKPIKQPKLADLYFSDEYKEYKFGEKRIQYLKEIKSLCIKHNISLKVSISPMNKEHFLMLASNKPLYEVFINFKKIVVDIFEKVYDFNNLSATLYKYPYWNNSVHPSYPLYNVMSNIILNDKKVGQGNFGKIIDKKNIEKYLEQLKASIDISLNSDRSNLKSPTIGN